ncbi:MAG: PKD domain-containing protein [Candidatus Gracilibacteria bacterium]|jgi:PKD repeat protein
MDEFQTISASALSPSSSPVPPATAEEKQAKRKAMLKRLMIVSGVVYVILLTAIIAWAFLAANSQIVVFNYLPFSQDVFSGFLFKLFNILLGILVFVAMVAALVGLIKGLLTKKEELDKKKKASHLALYAGISFFLLTILWLAGLWVLGPRLVKEALPPIVTIPKNTLGLTSPVEVTFDAGNVPIDQSKSQVLSYSWTFGDGASGNGSRIAHTYTRKAEGDGIYKVVLVVKYIDIASGQEFDYTQSVNVSIQNESTAASFTASPESGEVPLDVHFDATSSFDPDGEIVSYEWDFDGDGRYDDATGEEADYTFELEGKYNVSLRVTDNSGQEVTAEKTIEAGSVGGLRAVMTTNVGSDGIYYTRTDYEFNGTLSQVEAGKITKYSWDFGDGTKPVQSRTVTHNFSAAGTYSVTLTVQDQDGNFDKSLLEIKVVEEGTAPTAKVKTIPTAESSGKVSGAVPLEVVFDGSVSLDSEDDIVDYKWDFNSDGVIDDTGDTVTYTYSEVGTYSAKLILTDSAGHTAETVVPIEVTEQGVLARLTVSAANGEVPLTVTFDASGSTYKEGNIVSYEYNFGDGSDPYITGSSVTYKYTAVGTFTASVTAVGDDGTKGTASVQIVVRPVALTACFTVNTTSGSTPLFVSVDPSCSQGTVEAYKWDFGDGTISFDRKPETHTYSKTGIYTVKLEVTSPEGIVSTFENEITAK